MAANRTTQVHLVVVYGSGAAARVSQAHLVAIYDPNAGSGGPEATGSCQVKVGGSAELPIWRATQAHLVVINSAGARARATQAHLVLVYDPNAVYTGPTATGSCNALTGGWLDPPPQGASADGHVPVRGSGIADFPRGAKWGHVRVSGSAVGNDLVIDHTASGACLVAVEGGADVSTVGGSCAVVVGGQGVLRLGALATPCIAGDGEAVGEQNYVF